MKPSRAAQSLRYLSRWPEVWRGFLALENLPELLLAYLKLGRPRYPLELRGRSGLRIPLHDFDDVVTAWVVFCRREYRVDPAARLIVDAGANYGAFTLFAAVRAPAVRIVSLEPFPETHRRLVQNVLANNLSSRVTCYAEAVAAHTGQAAMNAHPRMGSPFRHLVTGDASPAAPTITVDTLSLAELLERTLTAHDAGRVDLLKIDVEGSEHAIFQAQENLDALVRVDNLQLEYHRSGSSQDLFAHLARAGFRCVTDRSDGPDHGVAHFRAT